MNHMTKSLGILLVGVFLLPTNLSAWVFSEHRDISVAAVLKLDAARRLKLDSMWRLARVGHEGRLTSSVVITALPEQPQYIDWAAWPAIGGDHSCSPAGMLTNILETSWILDVLSISEKFKRAAASAKNNAQLLNAVREQDIRLQRADPRYLTRAGSNNVHFLLAQPSAKTTKEEYVQACLAQGAELNAYAAYAWYHYRAAAKAARLRETGLSDAERSQLALSALADEAFAVHFLEDAFAAGHVTGTWGNASLRKGTHDYYNENGYSTYAWNDRPLILLGDAHMRAEDMDAPANAVATSLTQLIDAFTGQGQIGGFTFKSQEVEGIDLLGADTLDICKNNQIPLKVGSKRLLPQYMDVVNQTPVPALASGYGTMPRFRSELGGFIGFSPYLCAAGWNDDFSPTGTSATGVGSVGINIRIGLGLDGVMSDAGDGLAFVEIGMANDTESSTDLTHDKNPATTDEDRASIPGRTSISTRVRMPYYLIPGDLILGAILIAPFSVTTFTDMAVTASNGGLLSWQSAIATDIGRFQFMFGREVGVHFFGFTKASQEIWMPFKNTNNELLSDLVELRSLLVEAPIIEWRPYRTFSEDQHSSLVVQISGVADVPLYWKSMLRPNATVDLDTRYGLNLRIAFDWRYYY